MPENKNYEWDSLTGMGCFIGRYLISCFSFVFYNIKYLNYSIFPWDSITLEGGTATPDQKISSSQPELELRKPAALIPPLKNHRLPKATEKGTSRNTTELLKPNYSVTSDL